MRVEGLNAGTDSLSDIKRDARQRGVRGKKFAYWYLRRHGYVFAARNYVPRDVKCEIGLLGYEAERLVFVGERTARDDQSALSEVSVTAEKQRLVGRMARRFLMERHVKESRALPCGGDRRIFQPSASATSTQECFQPADVRRLTGKAAGIAGTR